MLFASFGSLARLDIHHSLARSNDLLFNSFGSLGFAVIRWVWLALQCWYSRYLARFGALLFLVLGSVPVYAGFIVSLCGRFYWPDRLISASLASCSFSSGFWIDVLLFRIQSRWRRKSIKCSIFPLNPSMSRFFTLCYSSLLARSFHLLFSSMWLAPSYWYSCSLARSTHLIFIRCGSVVLWPDYSSSLES